MQKEKNRNASFDKVKQHLQSIFLTLLDQANQLLQITSIILTIIKRQANVKISLIDKIVQNQRIVLLLRDQTKTQGLDGFVVNKLFNILGLNNIQIENNVMTVMKRLKNLVKVVDFFYSTQMLRYDDDLQYKTFTGGIVSLGIIVTIIVGFASMILNTLDLNTFTISTEIIKTKVPTPSVVQINKQSPFRFAIQIWRQNVTDSKRYFDITFQLNYQNYGILNTSTQFPFKPYPEITENFDMLKSSTWLCPTLNTTLYLQGKYSSQSYNQYIVQVSACNNNTDPSRPCASPQEIQNYFLQKQNFFYFVFYFSNTQINPDKKDYKQYYIEDSSYALFGSSVGSQTFLYLTDYKVQTDYSIWPFSKISIDSGCYAEDLGINHPFQTNINGTYIIWNIAKSTNSIVYTRQVQKLSIVLSFMGGMIGAASAVLFIIKIYTNVAFQFSIAFQIFKQKRQQSKAVADKKQTETQPKIKATQTDTKNEEMKMNFFNFVRFYFYQILDTIGYKYDSQKIKYAIKCQNEILKQLDVKKLLKRIIFIQHCLTSILDDYQLDALQVKKPKTPEQIKDIRLKCQSIVDHQFQQEKIEATSIKENSLKEETNIKLNQIETPTNLIKFIKRQAKQKKTGKRNSNLLKQDIAFSAKNEVLVLDIQDEKIEKKQPLQDSQDILGLRKNNKNADQYNKQQKRKSNKVSDQYNRQQKRKSNLAKLLANAEQGDGISSKIWKKLDNQIRKKTINYTKLDCDQ